MTVKRFPRQLSKIFVLLIILCLLTLSFGIPKGISAQTTAIYSVVATIPVGIEPNGIDVNENTNRIYVTNYSDDTVTVIDGNTNSVITTVVVGDGPSGIGVNPVTNKIYVANRNSGSPVSVIDGTTNTVIAEIPVNLNAYGVGINPNRNRIYVSVPPSTTNGPYVDVIDGATDTVISTIPCGMIYDPVRGNGVRYCSPGHIVTDTSTDKTYVYDYDGVVVIDNTDTVVSVMAGVGRGASNFSIGINKLTRRLYTGSNFRLDVPLYVADLDTQETVTTVPLPDGSLVGGIAVNEKLNHVYVASRTFKILDGATNTFLDEQLPILDARGVVVNQSTDRVYVANAGGNAVIVIEGPLSPPPQIPEIEYFALGDSIASGHGLSNNVENLCRPSDHSYPYKVKIMLEDSYQLSVDLHHFACSGATALLQDPQVQPPHKWLNNQVDSVITVLSQENLAPDSKIIVSVTIGVDDFPWTQPLAMAEILKSSYPDFLQYVDETSSLIADNAGQQMENILLRFPTSMIVVTEYPNPMNRTSHFLSLVPLGCGRIAESCYARVDYGIRTLNTSLKERLVGDLAERYPGRVAYVDGIYEAFQGGVDRKGLYLHLHDSPKKECGKSEPGITSTWIQYPSDSLSYSFPDGIPNILLKKSGVPAWRGDCFHPNNQGAIAYADLVFKSIKTLYP